MPQLRRSLVRGKGDSQDTVVKGASDVEISLAVNCRIEWLIQLPLARPFAFASPEGGYNAIS